MKNVAVIGAGYWGKNLVRVFNQLGALACVCDQNEETLKAIASQYPVKTVTSPKGVFDDPAIKAVVIATPADTHYKIVKDALLHAKDVFVEKPLSLKLKEGQEVVELAEKNGRILMVGHILDYHPAVIKLKELITSGTLGRIYYIYSNRLSFGKIRTEENILWSFAPHDISLILNLLGEEPMKIGCDGASYLQPGIFDLTMTRLIFASGIQAHIFVSWLHPYKEQKLVVVGEEKMALFDDTTEEKLFLFSHKVIWKDSIPTAHKAEAETIPFQMEEPLLAEGKHFLKCIADRKPSRTDGREGLRVLKVLDTCQNLLINAGGGRREKTR